MITVIAITFSTRYIQKRLQKESIAAETLLQGRVGMHGPKNLAQGDRDKRFAVSERKKERWRGRGISLWNPNEIERQRDFLETIYRPRK